MLWNSATSLISCLRFLAATKHLLPFGIVKLKQNKIILVVTHHSLLIDCSDAIIDLGKQKGTKILDYAMDNIVPHGYKFLLQAVKNNLATTTRKISYNLYNDTEQFEDITALFLQAGFVVSQEKHRYHHKDGAMPEPSKRLSFKTVSEVGEKTFTRAVEQVTVDSLDSLMSQEIQLLGSSKAAEEFVEGVKELDFNPDWWQLGYANDELVGLILPQRGHDTWA